MNLKERSGTCANMNAAMPSQIIEPEEIAVQNRREHTGVARAGWIEVIAGSMFSGKSEELIRRLRRAKIARQKDQVFKPEIDKRFPEHQIVLPSQKGHETSNLK